MGLASSKISTVDMPNPKPPVITLEVLTRLQDMHDSRSEAKTKTITICRHCRNLNIKTVGEEDEESESEQTTPDANVVPLQRTVWGREPPTEAIYAANSFGRTLPELEEIKFNKTFERINKFFFTKSHEPTKSSSDDFELIQQRVINCYREYRQEPLKCAIIAKQYHNYIFNKHFETLLNRRDRKIIDKEDGGDSDKSTDKSNKKQNFMK